MIRVLAVSHPRFVVVGLVLVALLLAGCPRKKDPGSGPKPAPLGRALHATPLAELNEGACQPGQRYVQEPLREPMKIAAVNGALAIEMVVALRSRCVPVWIPSSGSWEMQTLNLRTYGFPRNPDVPITEADANDPNSRKIAWSSPGPTFVIHTASKPGAPDGTRFKMRLYNRMPYEESPHACVPNIKCNTEGANAGIDPATGDCKVPPNTAGKGFPAQVPSQSLGGQVIEPPNCFHGLNSTNFHFHGFHVSPQAPQDNVSLELRPPLPPGASPHSHHGSHGKDSLVAYGHYDYALDPLRYTQAPGTHWYHAHKHGSTALHVLNGQVGSFEIRGEFDRRLEAYFEQKGGGKLADRLLVVQQIQARQPGLGGVDNTAAVLINGQGNPIVKMKRGEIQRWRFIGATMQASAALRIGFPDNKQSPEVRQIAMDGVQFSPDNYVCQPFLNNPDCTPVPDDSAFNELTAFNLSPGNRVDVLIKAPDTAGTHCMVLDVTTKLDGANKVREQHAARALLTQGTCGNIKGLGPLLTLEVEGDARPMTFPDRADFPPMPTFLADLPPVTDHARHKSIHYEMVEQGTLNKTQFWINQEKYNGDCANESLTIDMPEQWTLWNNSHKIAHPFHIHQNPFQLLSQSDRTTSNNKDGRYKYPAWRDVMPIPTAALPPSVSAANPPPDTLPDTLPPNSDPKAREAPWGKAVIVYVAKEFTGGFVNHCHILGHEDRGMMHNTQAVCSNGQYARTGPVPPNAVCADDGFCPSDCKAGAPFPAAAPCPEPLPQQGAWPSKYGVPIGAPRTPVK
jgi:FtsP/CotA-like multicopper oxidase with cupredoxin domain